MSVVILIGVYKSNNENVAQLWIKEDGRIIFNKLMRRYRYQQILRVLWFDDGNSPRRNSSEDKFQPIRDVFEQWDLNFRDAYTPGPHMTVDEQLVVSEEDAVYFFKTWKVWNKNLSNMRSQRILFMEDASLDQKKSCSWKRSKLGSKSCQRFVQRN